jgi:hypothetical protein
VLHAFFSRAPRLIVVLSIAALLVEDARRDCFRRGSARRSARRLVLITAYEQAIARRAL